MTLNARVVRTEQGLLDARARSLHVQLSYRILLYSERGLRITRLRVTPGEFRLLVAYHQSQGHATSRPATFMGYPVVVNRPAETVEPRASWQGANRWQQ